MDDLVLYVLFIWLYCVCWQFHKVAGIQETIQKRQSRYQKEPKLKNKLQVTITLSQSHLLRLSVGSLNAHTAESEDTASAAAGRQQLLDDGLVLFLQWQHDCGIKEEKRQSTNNIIIKKT